MIIASHNHTNYPWMNSEFLSDMLVGCNLAVGYFSQIFIDGLSVHQKGKEK